METYSNEYERLELQSSLIGGRGCEPPGRRQVRGGVEEEDLARVRGVVGGGGVVEPAVPHGLLHVDDLAQHAAKGQGRE